MAGDALKKVASGQVLRIPAQAYNAFVEAAEAVRGRSLGFDQDALNPNSRNPLVYVRNDSERDLTRYAVLGLDRIVITPQDNESEFNAHPVLVGVVPQEDAHRGRFAVLAEPLGTGRIGRAYLVGVCPVRITVPDDAESGGMQARWADIADDETESLTASASGAAEILWLDEADAQLPEGEADARWALVRLGRAAQVFPVRLEQTGGANGSASGPATWTYTLRELLTGAKLQEAVDPTAEPHQWRRPTVGGMSAATFGYAHYAADGQLALGWINETVEQEAC